MRVPLRILAMEALFSLAIGSLLSPESKRHETHHLEVTDTTGRTYRGFNPVPNIQAWLGIPYAQPPVGQLRWKPPKHLEPAQSGWKGRNATKFGKSCYQFKYAAITRDPLIGADVVKWGDIQTEESEDCLTLNIWAPVHKNKHKKKLLPVMVWVHGGGHAEGGSNVPGGCPIALSPCNIRTLNNVAPSIQSNTSGRSSPRCASSKFQVR